MAQRIFSKGTGASIVYDNDFGLQLDDGDALLSATVTASPSGLTLGAATATDGIRARLRISGGTTRTVYTLTWTCTTRNGETLQDVTKLSVFDRT